MKRAAPTKAPCPPVRELVEAARGERDDRHLRSCPSCRETVTVAHWLRTENDRTPFDAALDSAANLWWKAQIVRRLSVQQKIGDRTERSLFAIHGAAFAALLLGGTIWLLSVAPDFGPLPSGGLIEVATLAVAGFGLLSLLGAALCWLTAMR